MKKHIVFAAFLLVGCKDNSNVQNEHSDLNVNERQIDSLENLIDTLESQPYYWFNNTYEGKWLIDEDIENPREFIENALRSKPDLIPLKAVLGGTMRFGRIDLLGKNWLIAEYEDGHVYGRSLYAFELNDNGELEFTILSEMKP
ncbi:MAG: hypothetical protein HKO94_01760 [Flavobacteriaceae bacterium]|nr:hypothetical protein [Flavobacteriaceae bacterium]